MAADPKAEVVDVVFHAETKEITVDDDRVENISIACSTIFETNPKVCSHGNGYKNKRDEAQKSGDGSDESRHYFGERMLDSTAEAGKGHTQSWVGLKKGNERGFGGGWGGWTEV